MPDPNLPVLPLPEGVKSSYIDTTTSCGLVFHIISSGYDPVHQKPLILLLHGAPELVFTWRHIIAPLACEGYHVVAPDQRGYGMTTGWDTRPYDPVDLTEFHITNLVRDLICLVYALGYTEVHCIISHDFGTVPGHVSTLPQYRIKLWHPAPRSTHYVYVWMLTPRSSIDAPLMRPDIFKSSIQVSIPFIAPAAPAFDIKGSEHPPMKLSTSVHKFAAFEGQLEKLDPPRKHYQWYNSESTAAGDWMTEGKLGLRTFLRGYLYLKSHNWKGNDVHPPKEFTADQLAVMPNYLLMSGKDTMPEVVESMLKGQDVSVMDAWIPESDLEVYIREYQRTGFQGELNWYRVITSKLEMTRDALIAAGARIQVPTAFVTRAQDWSSHLIPGSIESYSTTCVDFRGVTIIPNAGHWIQSEQPKALLDAFISFLNDL